MAIELMTTVLCPVLDDQTLQYHSIILTGSRIPLAMLLTHVGMGLDGIWWAISLTSIVKGIVFTMTIPSYQPYKIKR